MRSFGLAVATAVLVVTPFAVGCESTDTAAEGKGSAGSGKEAGREAEAPKAKGPEADVELVKCSTDEFGQFPQAELKVTNNSSKTSNYVIQVEFLDGSGTRKAEGTAALNNLASGQVAEEKAVGLSKAPDGLKCKITKVDRYASL
jgi:hypothetical protein